MRRSSNRRDWLRCVPVVVVTGFVLAATCFLVPFSTEASPPADVVKAHKQLLANNSAANIVQDKTNPNAKPPWLSKNGKTKLNQHSCDDLCAKDACALYKRSSVYSKCCIAQGLMNKPTKTWPVIISSTPRSGTDGLTEILKQLGVKIAHDGNPSKMGMVSWVHIFSEFDVLSNPNNTKSHKYHGQGKLRGGRFKAALHLVREPLGSLTSLSCAHPRKGITKPFTDFMERHAPFDPPYAKQNRLRAGMQFWYFWHTFLDGLCVPLIRTEDFDTATKARPAIDLIFSKLKLPPPSDSKLKTVLDGHSHSANHRKHRPQVSWKELFQVDWEWAQKTLLLAQTYGYSLTVNATDFKRENLPRSKQPNCRLPDGS